VNHKRNIFTYILLSIIAAIFILVMTYNTSSVTIDIFDKIFIAGALITSCIFGISIAINPGWLRRFIKHLKKEEKSKETKKTKMKYKGHHPDCGKFKNHIINTKSKSFCTGCLGLTIGSIISIFLIIIYILTDTKFPNLFQILIIFGLFFISLSYVEIMIPKRYVIFHVISNIFLIIGFFIVTISILEKTGNIIYGMIGVTLSFLFLDTRVQLSRWQHYQICSNCSKSCKVF
jgi:hypothetical protein